MGNSEMEQFRQKAEHLQGELDKVVIVFPDEFSGEQKEVADYANFVSHPDLHVAVVGSIKAGKSTLLNAIFNEKITSTEVTPETAALTKIRYASQNSLTVTFHTEKEWQDLWRSASADKNSPFLSEYEELNAANYKDKWVNQPAIVEHPATVDQLIERVKEFTSAKKPAHYYVKELEIGLTNFPDGLPKEIVFVDTPGLDDVVPYRSQITKDYIHRANAILVCINAKTMRREEYGTIVQAFEQSGDQGDKILVLGTQVDGFNAPKADWEKQKTDWYRYLMSIFGSNSKMDKNVIGISSWIYSLVQDISGNKPVTDADVNDIERFASKNGIVIKPGDLTENDKKQLLEDTVSLEKLWAHKKMEGVIKNQEAIKEATNIPRLFSALKNGPLNNPRAMLINELEQKYGFVQKMATAKVNAIKESVEEQLVLLNGTIAEKQEAIKEKMETLEELETYRKSIDSSFRATKGEFEKEFAEKKEILLSELQSAIGGR